MSDWLYLPFLLVWALPVIALQWLAGGRYLWRERCRWPWVVLALGAYLTLADAVAIAAGIWSFDARRLSGLYLANVPLEEALFYLLTAAMVVQGFTIAWAAWEDRAQLAACWRARLARLAHLTRMGTRARRGAASRRAMLTADRAAAHETASASDA